MDQIKVGKFIAALRREQGVSVNELLAGERLSDEQFRKQADENLVEAVRESSFSVKERTEFFKKKWLRENAGLIGLSILFCVSASVYVWLKDAGIFSVLIWFLTHCWLNNRMMTYVEGKVYGGPKPPESKT